MEGKLKCKLGICPTLFEPRHGSQQYCSKKCYLKAKVLAQKDKYGGVKRLSEILARNESILKSLFIKPEAIIEGNKLITKGFDFSLVRRMGHNKLPELIILDTGRYYLETTDHKTYKIKKHEL